MRGAHVVVADRDEEAASRAAAWAVDLSHTEALEDLPLEVDIFVTNVGVQRVAPLREFEPTTFCLMQRPTVESPFLLIRAALPHMYDRGWGRIVNVSSAHGLRASAFKSAFVTAKHALGGLSKVTALEGAGHSVTSNCVNPSYLRTPLVQQQIATRRVRTASARTRWWRISC